MRLVAAKVLNINEMKQLFSERMGFKKPSDIVIRESMPSSVMNAVSSTISLLSNDLDDADYKLLGDIQTVPYYDLSYYRLKIAFWTEFLNRKYTDLVGNHFRTEDELEHYIVDNRVAWYKKLDCIEFLIDYMTENFVDDFRKPVIEKFIVKLNYHFERLRYGYRIIDGCCTDITSDEEISSILEAVSADDTPATHLKKALSHYSHRPDPDYANSIKESITAIEAYCREKTGESTFGPALNKLQSKGLAINPQMKSAFEKLYNYTNDKTTGIRHAMLDASETYKPSADEAYFMLIASSAFVNYLKKKTSCLK